MEYTLFEAFIRYSTLAHATAAAIVGVRVPVFSIGGGRHVRVTRIARQWLIFGLIPTEGLILLSYPSKNWYRAKSAFISAAGPLVNFACAAIGIAWLNQVEDTLPVYPKIATELFVIFGFLTGALNLLPFRANTPYGPISSDGRSILDLFSTTKEQIDHAVGQTTFVVAYFEYLFGSKSAAAELVEPLLKSENADVATKILGSAAYAETGEFEKGIDLCRATLEADDLDTGQRAILLNNLAYILELKNTPDSIDEADDLSEEAYNLAPMVLAIRSTRASILVAIGKEREAIELTRDKRFKIEPKVVQAHVFCTQATAYSRLGETALALASIRKAERLAAGDDRVVETRDALAGA